LRHDCNMERHLATGFLFLDFNTSWPAALLYLPCGISRGNPSPRLPWLFGLGPYITAFFAWLFQIHDVARYPAPSVVLDTVIKLGFILAVVALIFGGRKKE
jgi:hypothetical protein